VDFNLAFGIKNVVELGAETKISLNIEHIIPSNLKMEILSIIKKENITLDAIREIVINGSAVMTYEDCRALVTEEESIQSYEKRHLWQQYFGMPPEGAPLLPTSVLPNLEILDLSNAIFENDSIPDPPKSNVVTRRYPERTPDGQFMMGGGDPHYKTREEYDYYFSSYEPMGAFQGFSKLKKVILPDDLKRIGTRAFRYCINLESITPLQNLKSIGEDSFFNSPKVDLSTLPKDL
jgi:hypothetical protein